MKAYLIERGKIHLKKDIIEKNSLLTILPSKEYKTSVFNKIFKLNMEYFLILTLLIIIYAPTLVSINYIHELTQYDVFNYNDGIIRISYALLLVILSIVIFFTIHIGKKCLKTFLKLKNDLYHIYIFTDTSLIVYGNNLSVRTEYNWSCVKSIIFEHEKISFTIYDYKNISELNNTKQIDVVYRYYDDNNQYYTKIDNLFNHELNKIKSKVVYH